MTAQKRTFLVSVPDLPTDFPRPAERSNREVSCSGALDPAIAKQCEALGIGVSDSPNEPFLAAFMTLLSRYSGQTQSDLLVLEVENSEVEQSTNPESASPQGFLCALTICDEGRDRDSVQENPTRLDLFLQIKREAGRFDYRLAGNGNLFEKGALERTAGHFQSILAAILNEPDRPVDSISLLTETERKTLLVDWNQTGSETRDDVCVHRLFEEQAERTPDRIGVAFENESLTYRELNDRANRLAHRLHRLGVGPDSLVGVFVGRSLDLVVSILGILKAGGAYVPLDPEFPQDRLAFMIEDTAVPVILTQERLLESLPEHRAKTLRIDSDWTSITEEDSTNFEGNISSQNLAYAIYTSGSTGKPKGVLVEHRNVVNFFTGMDDRILHDPPGVWLAVTSLSFDISVLELFWTLTRGFTIVLHSEESPEREFSIARLIERHGVTHFQCTPSMAGILAARSEARAAFGSLQQMMVGGEAFPIALAKDLRAALSGKLTNMYGPTETTIWSTTFEIDSADPGVPIGRPIANTSIYILDPCGNPQPIGVPGELYIGGKGVVRGYHGRPELTAERFVKDPFSKEPNARMYRTGDLARYRKDGNIDFLGRLDHQVKIRGHRIELGEIESVLDSHPAIEKSIVVAREDLPGELRLVAYLTSSRNEVPGEGELRRYLGERIPNTMIPSAFVALEEFPLTPNGKVDRKALPAPQKKRPDLDQPYRAPRNDLEKRLAELWAANLYLDQVGVHDRFFDLGGNSLQAARVINQLQEELGETIYVVSLFEAPTIAEYTTFLQKNYCDAVSRRYPALALPKTNGAVATPRIEPKDVEAIRKFIPSLPLSRRPVDDAEPKNPGAIFILAPPRSGTTLLRVMLAGHPDLFCPAELQLLGFNTLAERKEAFTGKFNLWSEGTVRALMELERCEPDKAKALMAEYEDKGLTTKQFYKVLQDKLANRVLVDKSPSYASDLATLRKAEMDFENARFIHLVRHPYAMVRSFENYHMDQVLFIQEHPYSSRQLAELLWIVSHQNILEFLEGVPQDRWFRMRYEDLVSDPEKVIKAMCSTIDLDFHPNLLKPYENTDKKMTDGIYAESTPMGDKKFLKHGKIDAKSAESWKKVFEDNFLGSNAWEIAENLGYLQPEAGSPDSHPSAQDALRDSRAERRSGREDRRTRRLAHRSS